MKTSFQIAIDGPVGAGKSTVAKIVAERLGITYVYTGAMYRAVSLYARRRGIDWNDKEAIEAVVDTIEIDLEKPKKGQARIVTVLLFGEDVSDEVFGGDLGEGASIVSQYGRVRSILVQKQRELAQGKSVIMDGRDIGTNVLPQADLKVYLDADVDERIRRKKHQLKISLNKARDDVLTRDRREMSRENDPLKPAQEAWIFDTTDLSVEEVVDRILIKVKETQDAKK